MLLAFRPASLDASGKVLVAIGRITRRPPLRAQHGSAPSTVRRLTPLHSSLDNFGRQPKNRSRPGVSISAASSVRYALRLGPMVVASGSVRFCRRQRRLSGRLVVFCGVPLLNG